MFFKKPKAKRFRGMAQVLEHHKCLSSNLNTIKKKEREMLEKEGKEKDAW
jgi:hypothetical protein